MTTLRANHSKRLELALKFMIKNFHREISLDEVANCVGITKFSLCRSFRRELKTTPINWLWRYRTYVSAEIIWNYPHHRLLPIMNSCGFKHAAHFSRIFKNTLKMRPSAFKATVKKSRNLPQHASRPNPTGISVDILQKALHKTMETLI